MTGNVGSLKRDLIINREQYLNITQHGHGRATLELHGLGEGASGV